MEDYRTVRGVSVGEYEEKKSRFIAQLSFADSEEAALAFLEQVRAANRTARHNVYAYRLREGSRERYSDDGEPAKTAGTPALDGYGFAIPTTIMNKVVHDLKEFGIVQRAVLGVSGTDVLNYIDSEKEKGNTVDLGTVSGVYVNSIEPNSTAAELNLVKGDVITAIDGKNITKIAELQEELAKHRPGDQIKITYVRNKKTHNETVTLRNAQGNTKALEELDIDQFGAALKPLSEETKAQLNLPYGLEVAALRNGKMKDAGVTKGLIILMINDKPMRTLEDFEAVVKETNQSSDRTLWIRAITQSGIKKSMVIELNDPKDEKKK